MADTLDNAVIHLDQTRAHEPVDPPTDFDHGQSLAADEMYAFGV